MSKIEALSLSVVTAILLPTMLTSCGKKTETGKEKTAQKNENDFLDKEEDFDPYFNLKVGYFEFLPPSMLD